MGMDVLNVPLHGNHLVEASAGTGKTYTLTSLYLRLVLEEGLSPEQILVVTYTQAATAELKSRIRQRLLDVRESLDGDTEASAEIAELLSTLTDREQLKRQLTLAIAGFDQASIFTIHGFCQRVLTDYAFETGQGFQVELVPDQSERQLEIADDFWRLEIGALPPAILNIFREVAATPENLVERFRSTTGKPYLQLMAADWPERLTEVEREAIELQAEVRDLWQVSREEILKLLSDKAVMNGSRYRANYVEKWSCEMDDWLSASPYTTAFDKADRFTPEVIAKSVKKGKQPPEHPFFNSFADYLQLAGQCASLGAQAVVALQRRFYDYLQTELSKRQAEAGEWSYDDLLLQLHLALQSAKGPCLTNHLRKRYPAALVDEFQDTDPIQYEILRAIYQDAGLSLFLVGDPKQAIYSFRGADLFAYRKAREATASEIHCLDQNWRSTVEMVQGVNTLFSQAPKPFYYDWIEFQPAQAAKRSMDRLKIKGDSSAGLCFWQLPFDAKTSVEAVRQSVAEATAEEIARLLLAARQKRGMIGEQPLSGGDIAVLVRTHQQAERIASALRARGINSVRSSQESVFWSEEAEMLERLLLALLEPRRGELLRAALVTPLLGWDGEKIEQLNQGDPVLDESYDRFFEYHRTWRSRGLMVAMRRLLLAESVETRLLSLRDGERRLTNLYHLLELLHQQEQSTANGMEGLVKWLSRQRQSAERGDERLLRLESDSHLVQITTLHSSKGLEYPIVFCPYLWDESLGRVDDKPYLFHDANADYQAVLELGSAGFSSNRLYQREEALAENLRLLYVALTRAKFRCYLAWGEVKNSAQSALAWLLHSASAQLSDLSLQSWESYAKGLTQEQITLDLEQLQRLSQGGIEVISMPATESTTQIALEMPPPLAAAREFKGKIEMPRLVTSFSALIAGQQEDQPDYDGQTGWDPLLRVEPGQGDIHAFPRGAGPGSCVHAILEQLDFRLEDPAAADELIRQQLSLYGIDELWLPVVRGMLRDMLQTPLDAAGSCLQQIDPESRLNEMAFHFPVRNLQPDLIQRLSQRYQFSQSAGMAAGLAVSEMSRIQGFFKGYIDLVFAMGGRYYLADYKSNWLGNSLEDYHQAALEQAMVHHSYPLQYAIYSLALHRYLSMRLPGYDYERHFGGVYYLFLRGMKPQRGPGFGVLAERPSREFVEALDRLMQEAEDDAA
jgi:exodeoxyribonuclease V beta subunit